MKRFLIFPCVLCLVIGLLVGVLLPIDLWGEDAPPLMSPTIDRKSTRLNSSHMA